MIRFLRCIGETGANILCFQVGVIREDFSFGNSGSQQVENILNPYTHAANARASAALIGVEGDPVHCVKLFRGQSVVKPGTSLTDRVPSVGFVVRVNPRADDPCGPCGWGAPPWLGSASNAG